MADQAYPQIPSTVWWGVRQLLQRTPRAKFDDNMLAAQLGVQPAAAKQYLVELKRVGLLDEDGKGTDLANRWRMDESYAEAVEEIASAAYPEGLVTIAPPGEADRQRVVSWFMMQGLGEGSAKNKAATYMLITSREPNAAPAAGGKVELPRSSSEAKVRRPTRAAPTETRPPKGEKDQNARSNGRASDDMTGIMPLNVNVQIHISADASSEQIETIFSSMRKYLRND